MRILIIAPDYPPLAGGIGKLIFELKRSLEDDELRVLAPASPEAHQEASVLRLSFCHSAPWVRKFFQSFVWLGHALCFAFPKRTTVVFGCLFPLGWLGPVLRAVTRSPYLVVCHGSEVPAPVHPAWRRVMGKWILEKSAAVVTYSAYTENRTKILAPRAKIRLITVGVDAGFFKPLPKDPSLVHQWGLEGKKVLLGVGRQVRRKGFDTALQAFAAVHRRRSDVRLLFAGDGPERPRLVRLAEDLGVAEETLFAGEVAGERLLGYYALADVVLFLSREEGTDVEGFGLVALEAAACAKAVIGGRSGGVPEAVLDGKTGLIVDPQDVDGVRRAIETLLEQDSVRGELEQNARRHALARSWVACGRQSREALERIERNPGVC